MPLPELVDVIHVSDQVQSVREGSAYCGHVFGGNVERHIVKEFLLRYQERLRNCPPNPCIHGSFRKLLIIGQYNRLHQNVGNACGRGAKVFDTNLNRKLALVLSAQTGGSMGELYIGPLNSPSVLGGGICSCCGLSC